MCENVCFFFPLYLGTLTVLLLSVSIYFLLLFVAFYLWFIKYIIQLLCVHGRIAEITPKCLGPNVTQEKEKERQGTVER